MAEVNGQLIMAQALEEKAAPGLLRVERSVYQAKREHLERLIDDLLIEQEAKRRGISKDKLVAEVKDLARIPVSDEELEEFYDDNEELFPEGKEAAREKILRLVREEKAAEKLEEFADALRAKAKIAIFLSPPSPSGQRPPSQAQKEPPRQSVPASPTKTPAGVVAEVNGVAITAKALEAGLKSRHAGLQKTAYETRKAALEEMIGEALVDQEAKKRGLSKKEELFESVTGASKLAISSEQVEAIYRRGRGRQPKEDEQKLKDRITQGLRRQQALPKWKEFVEGLKARATIKTYVKAPAP